MATSFPLLQLAGATEEIGEERNCNTVRHAGELDHPQTNILIMIVPNCLTRLRNGRY